MRKLNEKLIYLSISGFGEKGPYAQSRVYDPVIQALSGATDIQADCQSGRPQMFRIIIADKVTSVTAHKPFHLRCLPVSDMVKASIFNCPCSTPCCLFWAEGMAGLVYGEKESDVRKLQGTQDLIYKAKDRYITAGAVSDAEWAGMCRASIRKNGLKMSVSVILLRVANAEERKKMTGAEIEKWDSEEILARFQEEGVPTHLCSTAWN